MVRLYDGEINAEGCRYPSEPEPLTEHLGLRGESERMIPKALMEDKEREGWDGPRAAWIYRAGIAKGRVGNRSNYSNRESRLITKEVLDPRLRDEPEQWRTIFSEKQSHRWGKRGTMRIQHPPTDTFSQSISTRPKKKVATPWIRMQWDRLVRTLVTWPGS